MRKPQLLPLLLFLPQSRAPAVAWNCAAGSGFVDPIQVLGDGGTPTQYRVVQLSIATSTFTELWQFGTETNTQPNTWMNGFAYNTVDGKACELPALDPGTSG